MRPFHRPPSAIRPPVAQLTALKISCSIAQLPRAWQDLRQLTSLEKLGLDRHRGQPALLSDTVTALYLAASSARTANFPSLWGCDRLEHVMLNLSSMHVDGRYDICAEQLPASAWTLWLDEHVGTSQLFLNMQAIARLRVRYVNNLGWNSDPAKLED